MAEPAYKRCLGCETEKPVDEFAVRRQRGKVDRRARCKKCEAARYQAWRKANPAKSRAQKHRHARRKTGRRLRFGNGMPSSHTRIAYSRILKGDPCVYCGIRPAIYGDHIVPQFEGGADAWHNLAAICGSCNSSKGVRSLLRFMYERKHGAFPLGPCDDLLTEGERSDTPITDLLSS